MQWGPVILFPCEDDIEPIGRGEILQKISKSTVLVQFWGGGSLVDEHKPCWYTNDDQEEKMKQQFFYGKQSTWTEDGVVKSSIPCTMKVKISDVLCSFRWGEGNKIPLHHLQEHCPELCVA